MLIGIPDKRQDKNTTSLKLKEDLIKYFKDLNLDNCIEVGTNHGWTTKILSGLFKKVITIENELSNIHIAQQNNHNNSNIEYLHGDAYNSDWDLPEKNYNCAFIDCIHDYDFVKNDIKNSLKYNVSYLIFDDYGLPENKPCVKAAVDEFISLTPNVEISYIGEPAGNEPRKNRPLVDWEGIILKLN
jgi:hypothetical protein